MFLLHRILSNLFPWGLSNDFHLGFLRVIFRLSMPSQCVKLWILAIFIMPVHLEFISSDPLTSRYWTSNTCVTGGMLRNDTTGENRASWMKEHSSRHEHQYQHRATAGPCRTVETVGVGHVAISDGRITVSITSLSSKRLCWLGL